MFQLELKKEHVELHLPVAMSYLLPAYVSCVSFLQCFCWFSGSGAGDDEAWQLLQETWTFSVVGEDPLPCGLANSIFASIVAFRIFR